MKTYYALGTVILTLVVCLLTLSPTQAQAQPLGCCTYDGAPTCTDMDLSDLSTCVEDMDGDPHPLVTCDAINCLDTPADKYACCMPDDACVDVIGRDSCYVTLNAIPFARETCVAVSCETLPRNGICCTAAEACTPSLDVTCGDYFIEGGVCGDDACAPIRGACCTAFGCESLSEELCTDAGGTFHGIGSECDPLLCERACCQPGGGCDIESDLVCELHAGTSVDDLTCSEDTCIDLETACCLPGLDATECLELDAQTCGDAGGVSYDSLYCDELTCPDLGPETSACCTNGMCADIPAAECIADGGQRLDGISCRNLGVCPPPELGACCVASPFPICSDRASESSCLARAGAWYRETPCAELDATTCNVVTGACCNEGVCSQTFEPAVCEAGGGRFLAGASCDDIDCSQGACCLGEFGCASYLYPDQCDGFGGSFFEAQRCRDIECESACCTDDGACSNLLREDCSATDGITVGSGVLCDHVMSCPALEIDTTACCERDICTDAAIGMCDGTVYPGLSCSDFAGGVVSVRRARCLLPGSRPLRGPHRRDKL